MFGIVPVGWFYRDGRATAAGRAFSRFWAAWASLGLPAFGQVGLEVLGRKTGRPLRVAVVVVRYEGEKYLVSMLGECAWVKNVRARGEAALIGRRRSQVRLEEVPVGRRAAIIQEFVRVAPGARPHVGLGADATLAACERVAGRHPVFRIVDEVN